MPKLVAAGDSVTLREYVDMRISSIEATITQGRTAEQERALAYRTQSELVASAIEVRFTGIKENTALAAAAVEKRLESMNEFREQLNTQAASFITTKDAEEKINGFRLTYNSIINRLGAIESSCPPRNEVDKQFQTSAVVHDSLMTRIVELEKSAANFQGRMWAIGVGVTVLSIGISIALHFIH